MTSPDKSGGSRNPSRWKPGQSGNPAGKPPGLATPAALRQRLADEIDPIVQTVIDAAKKGDLTACRLVLERVLPAIKPIEMAHPIPMPADGGLLSMGERIMLAVGEGTLAPGPAATLLSALGSLAKIKETEELERRLEELERRLDQ